MTRFLPAAMCLLGLCNFAVAANPHVYRIQADEFKLTGFRLQGERGIVTALHGVAGRANLRALCAAKGSKVHVELKIVAVDIGHDVALLNNGDSELQSKTIGFVASKSPAWVAGSPLTVIGYPDQIYFRELQSTIKMRGPAPLVPLELLVGPTLKGTLEDRCSPDPTKDVLSIEGELLGGHSGAPILDPAGEVIAVANGGLKNDINWSIPWKDVRWQPVDEETNRKLLALKNSGGLYNEISVLDKPIELKQAENKAGGTTAKASGKVSWLPDGDGIRMDVNLYVRKSGVGGKGYAFARVDLLDAVGNTLWSSEIFQKHKGANLAGTAEGSENFVATAPAALRSQVTNAVVVVRAEDSDGLTPEVKRFFGKVSEDIKDALINGRDLPEFQKLHAL